MGTPNVRINPNLNVQLWGKGIRKVPHKMRIKITRKIDTAEESAGSFVSELEYVPVDSFKELVTEKE